MQTSGPGGAHVLDIAEGPSGELYALTSYYNFEGTSSPLVTTVFRTAGIGDAWDRVAVPDSLQYVSAIDISPHGVVFLKTNRAGLYRSFDDGATWEWIAAPGGNLTFRADGRAFQSGDAGIFFSDDAGTSWTQFSEEPAEHLYFGQRTGALYATQGPAIYRFDGATRTPVHTFDTQSSVDISGIIERPDGELDVSIAGHRLWGDTNYDAPGVYRVDAEGNARLLGLFDHAVSGLVRDEAGRLFAATRGYEASFETSPPAGVWMSDDDGATWQQAGLESVSVWEIMRSRAGQLLAATTGFGSDTGRDLGLGIAYSEDGQTWHNMSDGIAQSQAYSLAYGVGGLYAAANQSIHRSVDRGMTWQVVYTAQRATQRQGSDERFPPFLDVVVHPDGDVFALMRDVDVGYLLHSADEGATWTEQQLALPGGESYVMSFFYGPPPLYRDAFAVSRKGTLLIGIGGGLLRSEDKGASWTQIPVGADDGFVAAFGVAHGFLLAVAVDNVYVSSDDGVTWAAIEGLSRTRFASGTGSVYVDEQGRFYISTERITRLTHQNGVWLEEDVPDAEVRIWDLVARDDSIFIAVPEGVYVGALDEAGERQWELLGRAFATGTQALLIDDAGYLYMGTRLPNGVWRSHEPVTTPLPLDAEPETLLPEVFALSAAYPNPFRQRTTIPFTLARPGPVTLVVYDVLGREVERLVQGAVLPAGAHTRTWQTAAQGSGVYLVKLIAGGRVETQQVVLLN